MLKPLVLVGLLSVVAVPAMAQSSDNPRFEVGGGYSYVRARITSTDNSVTPADTASASFDLHGGRGEVVAHVSRTFGFVGEFGGYKITGLPSGVSAHLFTYMFGPRLTYRESEKVEPFVHALFGGVHASGSVSGTVSPGFEFSGSENSFAMALGGGLDYKIHKNVAIRFVQADYLMTRFKTNINSAGNSVAATQNNFRIGAGIQFRF
jgi:opacity protein-like surface antigen